MTRTLFISGWILGAALVCTGCASSQDQSTATSTADLPPAQSSDASGSSTAIARTATASASASETASATSSEPPHMIVGGYADADPAKAEVVTAAGKAVDLLKQRTNDNSLALKKIVSARTQVVAGMNYELNLELTSSSGTKTVKVVIYQDLKRNYSLTSVEGI